MLAMLDGAPSLPLSALQEPLIYALFYAARALCIAVGGAAEQRAEQLDMASLAARLQQQQQQLQASEPGGSSGGVQALLPLQQAMAMQAFRPEEVPADVWDAAMLTAFHRAGAP